MRKFLPVVFCGIAAISYGQLVLAYDPAVASDSTAAARPGDASAGNSEKDKN